MHILQNVQLYIRKKQYLVLKCRHILKYNLYIHKLQYFQFIYVHVQIGLYVRRLYYRSSIACRAIVGRHRSNSELV